MYTRQVNFFTNWTSEKIEMRMTSGIQEIKVQIIVFCPKVS